MPFRLKKYMHILNASEMDKKCFEIFKNQPYIN